MLIDRLLYKKKCIKGDISEWKDTLVDKKIGIYIWTDRYIDEKIDI